MDMGKKGNRRTVLQLSDNKESFLARYGYRRQENEDEDSRGAYDPDDDSEEDLDKYAQDSLEQGEEQAKEVNGAPADIDNKVADFLAEIDALPAHDAEADEDDEEEAPPSFKAEIPPPSFTMEIPPPSFKLSADQQGKYQPHEEQQRPKEVTETKPKYKSMFVKGEVEFTRQADTKLLKGVKDEEEPWPEEPTTVWQQTLDDNTQCYYYWNTVTNEVTWEIPSGYTQYLLMHKEYEATVDRLTKEGRVKPVKVQSVDSSVSEDKKASVAEKGDNPSVSSTSTLSSASTKKASLLKNKETAQPDSTISKPKKPTLVDATYFDDSEEESSSSEIEDDKPPARKPSKKQSDSDPDIDMDIDDIDKALEMALEKNKPGEKSASSKDSKSSRDKKKEQVKEKKSSSSKEVKQTSLVEEMKAQVQKRQELEARRKAAIEEMMARELERRVGPPRKRPSEEEAPETVWDSKRSKVVDYGHSSRKSREREHSSHRSSVEKDHHGDSKRKHDDRKAEKKRRREEKEERRRDRDEKSDRKKDRDRSREKDRDKKDKHKDEKKRDKKDKDSKKEDKKSERKEEKSEKKKEKSEIGKDDEKNEEKEAKPEVKEVPARKTEENKIPEVKPEREISKEVELANLKMQASELADLALSKLEFLEVTKKGLSKLQILLIELETRHQDWQGGGLNTEFFVTKLEEANWQLQQYEQSAAPPGWTCHWDRAYRRYFYMNKKSSRTQWDYPDDDDEEEDDGEEENVESDKEEKMRERVRDMEDRSKDREDDYGSSKGTSPEDGRSAASSTSGRDVDQVSSTTAVHTDVTTAADTTTKTARPKQSAVNLEDNHLSSSNQPPQPKSDQQSYRSTDYLGAQDMSCILRGEPPPPGTDLELLLTAPPPPPPLDGREHSSGSDSDDSVDYESGRTFTERVHREEDMEMDSNEATSSNVQTFTGPSDMGGTVYSQSDTAVSYMMGSNGVSETPDAPVMIARAPQIFSSEAKGSGDGYYDGATDSGLVTGSFMMSSTGQETVEGMWSGDGNITQQTAEREKKKKKKDKTISSTSLTLKKKNVSGLVQKWQKVKKEVEIEERNREEREMAIRQQLEELKQEYS